MSKTGSLKRLMKQINPQVWPLKKKKKTKHKSSLSGTVTVSIVIVPFPLHPHSLPSLLPVLLPPSFSSLHSHSSCHDVLSRFPEPSHCGLKSGKPTNQNKPFCPEIVSVRYFVSLLRKITNTENGYQEWGPGCD